MKGVDLARLRELGATIGPPVRLDVVPPAALGAAEAARAATWDLADGLRYALQLAGVRGWEPEFRFAPPRRWRFDVAFPAALVAVECEGGIEGPGGHTDPERFRADLAKYNTAALAGWLLVRVTGRMIQSGEALALIERALAARKGLTR